VSIIIILLGEHTERSVMSIDYYSIGERVKFYRENKKLSQMALAELCNISRQHMSMIETGERIASIETIVTIANILEVSPNQILSECIINANGNDLTDILIGCSPEEIDILTENLKDLKSILKKHTIK